MRAYSSLIFASAAAACSFGRSEKRMRRLPAMQRNERASIAMGVSERASKPRTDGRTDKRRPLQLLAHAAGESEQATNERERDSLRQQKWDVTHNCDSLGLNYTRTIRITRIITTYTRIGPIVMQFLML